uniref:Hemoglobin subunit alpha-A n=2 Tax=Zeugodacus cucurbitae TaxID=28588 RepID=A0A0A1XJI5_ZEUCU
MANVQIVVSKPLSSINAVRKHKELTEFSMSSNIDQNQNGSSETKPVISFENPKWLTAELFEKVLSEFIPKYRKITHFEAKPALAAGENYATVMLRIQIDVELSDASKESISLMMKLPQENEILKDMMRKHNIFEIEYRMYHEVLPEFNKMYLDVGVNAMFSANCYNIETPSEFGVILLEDLRPLGYKNANRLEGLNLEHTKAVLERLAQWHAASATRVETKGIFPEIFIGGMFSESQRETMHNFCASIKPTFLSSIKTIEDSENYLDDLVNVLNNITDLLFTTSKYDPNEFNVLNHGDCWSNNIMFKYDAEGKIVDTILIDYQMVNYGSPAKDLLYFLLSSTSYELKIEQFNYLIKFYHENLVKNLTLLKYPKKLPTLKEIHCSIIKYGIWGLSTVFGVMAAALLEPNKDANIDSFISDSDDGDRFRTLMFFNPRYRKHLEIVMPWMSNLGVFEV